MIHSLHHRGPDGTGFCEEGPVMLAHARLSIIDLSTGSQPMCDDSGEVCVIFNGEIFNFIELRDELRTKGHHFRTTSDTETIVYAYKEFGDTCFEHLNGQFAIAIWDRRRQRLLLGRDRTGIRPLFYTIDNNQLLFASEIKAIKAALGRGLNLDAQGLAQIFTYWGTIEDKTVFEGIRSLPAGCALSVDRTTQRIWRYWDWDFRQPARDKAPSMDEAIDELKALLADSIRLQLRSDVPVAAYLSGGLDSSGIVALARQQGADLRTFSVTFDDGEFDESQHQLLMAQHLGTRHTTLRCTHRDIGEQFPRLIWHTESPVLRTAPVPLMMLSGMVRDAGYKVTLTGEGADEVFGGYDLFKEGKIRRFWARQPESTWRPALFSRLYPYLQHSPVSNVAYARSFFGQELTPTQKVGYAHLGRWSTTRRLWNFFSSDMRSALAAQPTPGELQPPSQFFAWEGLTQDQYVEAKTLLSGYLLSSQGDRVAMANSVEGRVPYLDHRLIEFAGKLPASYKLRGLTEKHLLKQALRDVLPKDIVSRTKQPYRAPDAPSFFSGGKPLPYVRELLLGDPMRDAGLFDPVAVTRLLEKCRQGKAIGFADNMALVGIISTMLVHDQFTRTAPLIS